MICRCATLIAIILVLAGQTGAAVVFNQSRLFDIYGEVKDQRGDVIAGAQIILTRDKELIHATTTDERGRFDFSRLAAAHYSIKASAEGFADHEEELKISSTQPRSFQITLYPAVREKVSVTDDASRVSLESQTAAGSKTLKQKELEALADDPDRLNEQLQLLATSSGSAPGTATVTVDGFLNEGRLPPKSSIQEVRINADLFSAEHDQPPYRGGRIEIITKPGASAYHGSAFVNFNDSALNARDVFAQSKAQTTTRRYGFQFGGPIQKKRSGFLTDFETRDINESETINAIILDASFRPSSFVANAPTPKLLLIGSVRTDWQINSANTFIARYDFTRDRLDNEGLGGFNLFDRAYNSRVTSHSLRLAETSIINKAVVNEARFSVTLRKTIQQAASNAPAIIVPGAFSAGGAAVQSLALEEKRFELVNNLSVTRRSHSLKMGAQILGKNIRDARSDNFNGAFVFGGGLAPRLDSNGRVNSPEGPLLENISGLEQYRRALLGFPGVPTRFSITTGNPLVPVNHWTFAGFVQDEWRPTQSVALNLGLRYEGQTAPADGISLGPRVGVAYSPDKRRQWVLRARAGIFFSRIAESVAVETLRLDGARQKQLIIDSPSFPDPFSGGTEIDLIPTVRRLDPRLRPPGSLHTQAGFERLLPQGWKLEASYSWSRGWANLRSRNINAPLVDKGGDPLTASRPFGVKQNVLQFESSGSINGRVLFVGINQTRNKLFNLYSGYLLFDFQTDADNPFTLPQSSYDFAGERARPSWQSRHIAFIVAILSLPRSIRASANFSLTSGRPFNITTGRDNNGDGNFNDRPDVADESLTSAIRTRLGSFDSTAINGTLPRNSGTGPTNATLDLNLSRAFQIGRKGANADGGYRLTLNARVSNLLNRANLLAPNGVLSSPFFGLSNSAAPARRIEVGARFNF